MIIAIAATGVGPIGISRALFPRFSKDTSATMGTSATISPRLDFLFQRTPLGTLTRAGSSLRRETRGISDRLLVRLALPLVDSRTAYTGRRWASTGPARLLDQGLDR
jgi:hypothetical protein